VEKLDTHGYLHALDPGPFDKIEHTKIHERINFSEEFLLQ